MRNLAVLIFDNAEVLDFAGPYEAFSVAEDVQTGQKLFNVYMVAERARPVVARNGFTVMPDYTLYDCPKPDIVLLPGGDGRKIAMHNPLILDWVRQHHAHTELTLSVCTGAFFLAKAGLLDGLHATTYHECFEELQAVVPSATLHRDRRWVDNGNIITSAGVSAGIDMSLYVIGKLHGADQAAKTARDMEYDHYRP
jgi:transcriptional regulator GlxA family with amidase domain